MRVFLLLLLILITGCTKVTCNSPYIHYEDSCCLDEDKNGVCDDQEVDKVREQMIKDQVEKITEERISSITDEQIERITGEQIEKVTKDIIAQRTEEITQKMFEQEEEEYECNLKPLPREFTKEHYYTGSLIDTHVHMPVASSIVSNIAIQSGFEDMPHEGDISIDHINCVFDSEGIIKTFGFFLMPNIVLGQSVNSVKKSEEKYPGKFVPFFAPPLPIHNLVPNPQELEDVLAENPGLFGGYGETKFAFGFEGLQDALPEDSDYLEIYNIAAKENLVVMIHPWEHQMEEIESILKSNPDVNFLLHGVSDVRDEVGNLMGGYSNLFYSIDADLTLIFGWAAQHDHKIPTKDEWMVHIRKNFDTQLNKVVLRWKPLIEKHPNQFVWGTDRWHSWHFDHDAGGLMEEFGRSFIGHLDEDVQEKFAYQNAENMLE